ncbi:MAG: CobW family GTP-binding protein [Butyricicoccus sp.]
MSQLYLITGFLGAGKTTFLRNFIRLFAGKKIQLIVNEFGREGVDGALLADLDAFLQEISGGSVFCSCRLDQFEKVLRESSGINADVILVEASGLSDPTGVRRLFSQTDRFPNIEYMGGICLIDAVRFPKLYATARPCIKQLAASDLAIVNKIDRATPEQLAATMDCIRGQRPEMKVLQTTYGQIEPSVLELLAEGNGGADADMPLTADLTLRSIVIRIAPSMSAYALQKFIEMFLETTFRVKGFIQTSDGLMQVDGVGNVVDITPYDKPLSQDKIGWLTVLSGSKMPVRKAVKDACAWYPNDILSVE